MFELFLGMDWHAPKLQYFETVHPILSYWEAIMTSAGASLLTTIDQRLTTADVQLLSVSCPNIEHLTCTSITTNAVTALSGLPSLRSLTLIDSFTDHDGWQRLTTLVNLSHLTIKMTPSRVLFEMPSKSEMRALVNHLVQHSLTMMNDTSPSQWLDAPWS
jgi:hypothetical protein